MSHILLDQLKSDLKRYSIRIVPPGEEFSLSSGAKSRIYCDLKQTAQRGECMGNLARVIEHVTSEIRATAFAGVALGGCHLASLMAIRMGVDVIYVRKESKDHGTKKLVEAPRRDIPESDQKVVLLEDVTTTANSARKALSALWEEGFNVSAIITVVDRRDVREPTISGVPLFACVNLEDLVEVPE